MTPPEMPLGNPASLGAQSLPSSERDEMIKHLEFIQAIIARQAGNSFLLKAWSITLVAGLFALAAKDASGRFAWLALLPTFGFCGLDAYYLHQEKRFRQLYDWVRRGMMGVTEIQRQEIGLFCLDPACVPIRETRWGTRAWAALLSPSVWPFYGLLFGAQTLAILLS